MIFIFYYLLPLVLHAVETTDIRNMALPENATFAQAVQIINTSWEKEMPTIAGQKLTVEVLKKSLVEYAKYEMSPSDRVPFIDMINKGFVPKGNQIRIVKTGDTLYLEFLGLILDKSGTSTLAQRYETRSKVQREGRNVCFEEFSEIEKLATGASIVNFPVRTKEIKTPGQCRAALGSKTGPLLTHPEGAQCKYDALEVEVMLDEQTVQSLVGYFGVGFNAQEMKQRLVAKLKTKGSGWVPLQSLFPNWLSAKVDTFPNAGDNEVCHGPARQFFSPTLQNGSMDRSTEAVGCLLEKKYCRLANGQEPRFGDYIYAPTKHSGRYILKDPKSGRGVVFAVNSGGTVPYRFWWLDEEFSGRPFAHEPSTELSKVIDIYRRCKPNTPDDSPQLGGTNPSTSKLGQP